MKRSMDQIGKNSKERLAKVNLNSMENEIRKYILMEFANNGRPPDPEEITERLNLSSVDIVNKVIDKLQKADLLSRNGEEIISAYPFSALETYHKVIFDDGHEVYALCATDALGIHFMLNKDITILSRCPECEGEISVIVKDHQIDSYIPNGLIEFVSNIQRCGCTAKNLCPYINFFCSEEHLNEWREKNPQYKSGEIYSLNEALEHGKTIFADLLK